MVITKYMGRDYMGPAIISTGNLEMDRRILEAWANLETAWEMHRDAEERAESLRFDLETAQEAMARVQEEAAELDYIVVRVERD